ncbi:metallophosphoesterase [Methanobacterium paludis]|uniref:Metallophosphoesterase n=1 Tax=Methanobacterium paludis (strain DSM 25820 / JCM 18151 / SWAN1) TaxID=868131 RepID=F6D891_METPW|nr:metallophosphoesterase [Methanobacterium paludis]AEG17830.1 metallophosphoesterase [Methanobacterium paludis]
MFKKIVIIIAFLFAIALAYSYFIEPYMIETKEITIQSDQIPAEFNGKTIVFITDIHCSQFFSAERVGSLVNQVNALNPDMVLLGGDYVTDDTAYIQPCFSQLSKLKAPLGVYGVLGNNDPYNATIAAMENAGITYIGNKGLWIEENGQRIRLGGVGDLDTDIPYQGPTIGAVNSSDFVIMVSHKPDYFPLLNKKLVDLMFAGHTHGGQVTFFGLWAPFTGSKYGQKYLTGVKESGNSTMIVSNGIGTVKVPLRFFARPQIIVVKLERTS